MEFKIRTFVILVIIISSVFGTEITRQSGGRKSAFRATSVLHHLLNSQWHRGKSFDLTHSSLHEANSTGMRSGDNKARDIGSDIKDKLSRYEDVESLLADIIYLNIQYAPEVNNKGMLARLHSEDAPLEATSDRVAAGFVIPDHKQVNGVLGNTPATNGIQTNDEAMKDSYRGHRDSADAKNVANVIGQVLWKMQFGSPVNGEARSGAFPTKVSDSGIDSSTPLTNINKNDMSRLSNIGALTVSKIQKSKESNKHTYTDEIVNDLRQLAKQIDVIPDGSHENREAISSENNNDSSHPDININKLLNSKSVALAYNDRLIPNIVNEDLKTPDRGHAKAPEVHSISELDSVIISSSSNQNPSHAVTGFADRDIADFLANRIGT